MCQNLLTVPQNRFFETVPPFFLPIPPRDLSRSFHGKIGNKQASPRRWVARYKSVARTINYDHGVIPPEGGNKRVELALPPNHLTNKVAFQHESNHPSIEGRTETMKQSR